MYKLKLFIENFLVYGLGGIISKIIPLFMLPIVTRLMPGTEYFGINDMSNTIVGFASAFAIMGMYDAMYRMFFEKEDEEYKKTICSTALIFTIATSMVVFLIMIVFKDIVADFFFKDRQYAFVVYLSAMATLVGSTNSIISAPTRMQNKRKIFLITNAIAPIISYSIAIPMLLAGYYIIALPIAAIISGVTMELIFGKLNYNWFSLRKFDSNVLKQLLTIAIPLMPNFIIYWIFNSSDRVMVTNLIGIGAVGIYSVGSKLGNCSHLIYSAFAGGWQYFSFSTMKEENQIESNSKIFEYLGVISFIISAFVFALSFNIYKVIFPEDYLSGYIVAPYLFLAPLLQMLFQVAANQFLIIKNTWPNMFILSIGAIVNIFLNILFIPIIGIEGAAIATLCGYVISDVICCIILIKMKLMIISRKFILVCIIMIIYILLWRFFFTQKVIFSLLLASIVMLINIYTYRKDIQGLIKNIQI